MITRMTRSWDELWEELRRIETIREQTRAERAPRDVSELLYRGHSSSRWRLDSTLQRSTKMRSVTDYYRTCHAIRHEIESFTGRRWNDLPTPSEYAKGLDDTETLFGSYESLPAYEYQVYLRHHGFPSPLLDWTRSPYVAAYFAFAGAGEEDYVSVFAYVADLGRGTTDGGRHPYIVNRGPFVSAHPRHFIQQSQYTVCLQQTEDELQFGSHQAVFDLQGPEPDQDALWRIDVPAIARPVALRQLDAMNINAYSLFRDEEALMTTAAFRWFERDAH